MFPAFNLDQFLNQLSHRLALAGSITIHRPTEAGQLEAIPRNELVIAAARHGMRVVRRMGGTSFEFIRRASGSDFPYRTLKIFENK